MVVIEFDGDEDQAIAALLHDAVEDQGGAATAAEIRRRFGDRVAELVEACSDSLGEPKPPWPSARSAPGPRRSHWSGKTADRGRQAAQRPRAGEDYSRLGENLWAQFRGGKAGTKWYYRAAL